jgi:hypothetical protein
MNPKKAPAPSGRLGILSHPEVRRWYDRKVVRSRVTGDEYARKLAFVLDRLGLDPDTVVTEATGHPDKFEDRLVRYASDHQKAGRLDNYIRKSLGGLRSYLAFLHVAFDRWPEVSPVEGASLESERVPRPEELDRVLARLSPRGRVVALMMAHAGVRPAVLGSYRGAGGLTLGDLPELGLGKSIGFSEIPTVIRVPAALSKTRVAYTTFGTRQLCEAIIVELERRRRAGEKLSASSPLVAAREVRGIAAASRASSKFGGKFLVTKAVLDEVRDALSATAPEGVHWRGYVLRSYASTRLLIASGNGRISRDLAEALLGHSTGVAGRYHVGKKWGEELLAEARREYAAACEFLETNGSTKTDVRRELVESLVRAVEESTGGKVGSKSTMTAEQLIEALKRSLGAKASLEEPQVAETTPPILPSSRTVQKAVPPSELDGLLQTGWSYRGTVAAGTPGERVVVELRQ